MAKSFLGLQKEEETTMVKERSAEGTSPETVMSIIGPGMTVVGDCDTDGTIRIDGKVEGTVRAGKAVVVGKEGTVEGEIRTQDAIVSGRVEGTLTAESRLELQSTCRIRGEINARRMQLEEGAVLNGKISMGDSLGEPAFSKPAAIPSRTSAAAGALKEAGKGSEKSADGERGKAGDKGDRGAKTVGKGAGKS